ncbi:Do family serine endopeptidase [Oleiagrimonas sp. C23AA]|uniref:Do family serine endopeptidase n=1 Tax=Oleiagrimonas sp. C23AA TaxID=2719047 RepID=UPI001421B400|nr:Do family serine endopeptidase [Oleiagrimonas sp. C23AA]NII10390.1 Do family serine endopeptidase [Oleiagrimonas sp. C23AA]
MSKMTMRVSAWFALLCLVCTAAAANAAQLPDFTGIVKKNAPAVVRIEAKYNGDHPDMGRQAGMPGQGGVPPEILRRFFGIPGMPSQPTDPAHASLGSGFIISNDGYILTNDHVVDDADKVTVRLQDRRTFTAKVVGTDKLYDIALLKIKAKDLPTVTIGDSSSLQTGQWVLAIGSPFAFDYTVTQGIVSATHRALGAQDQQYTPFIQTDVPINPGNSGGPLLNLDGQVVGINSQIYSKTGGYMGVSFAIPINEAMNAVQQLKKNGYVARGQLGVYMGEVDADKAKGLGMKRAVGALVVKVKPGSAAAKAGLQPSDVVLAYNGHDIDSAGDLPPMVAATKPGTQITLKVFHQGKIEHLKAKLDAMPRDGSDADWSQGGGADSSAKLGFTVEGLTSDQREALGMKKGDGGVVIQRVTRRDAAQSGLRPGYVVMMVGQHKVTSVAEFHKLTAHLKPGQTVLLLVRDSQGNSGFVTVTVPEKGD